MGAVSKRFGGGVLRASLVTVGLTTAACEIEQGAVVVPTADQVAGYYEYAGDLSVEMSGNVAQLTARMDRDEYRMGGRVWAMAAPYVFLFSPATRQAFQDYSGLGGVRVIVHYEDGSTVAQALLERGTLNEITWQRALGIAAQARNQGTESPGYMRDLVRWGEDHTDYQYNPEYVRLP